MKAVRLPFTNLPLPHSKAGIAAFFGTEMSVTVAASSRRIWIMTIRRFAEVAWPRHGPTRYVSVALTPLLVALLAPGPWWIACAAGAAVGVAIDLRAHGAFQRLCVDLESLDDRGLHRAVRDHIAALGVLTAAYVLPYATLAFAPQPGPVIGLL